jgi:hypothetical protein
MQESQKRIYLTAIILLKNGSELKKLLKFKGGFKIF